MKKSSKKTKEKSTMDILCEARDFLKKNLPEGSHIGVWYVSKDISCFEATQEANPPATILAGSSIQHHGLERHLG